MPFPLIPLIISAAPALIDAGVKVANRIQAKKGTTNSTTRPTLTRAPSMPSRPRPWPGKPTLPPMDDEQRESLSTIAAVVRVAELRGVLANARPALTLALWANAWHESRLRPGALNPGRPGRQEDSVGLFQINRAVHTEFSRQQLVDPVLNTRVILSFIQAERARYDDLLGRGGTVADLTGAVTLWAERPADTMRKARERAQTVVTWFPEVRGRQALSVR